MDIKILHANETAIRDFYGVKLVIGRKKNSKFIQKYRNLLRDAREAGKDLTDEKYTDDLMCESLAGTVLVGWSNFFIDNEELPYSDKNAATLMRNDVDAREFIVIESDNLANFIDRERMDTRGKS